MLAHAASTSSAAITPTPFVFGSADTPHAPFAPGFQTYPSDFPITNHNTTYDTSNVDVSNIDFSFMDGFSSFTAMLHESPLPPASTFSNAGLYPPAPQSLPLLPSTNAPTFTGTTTPVTLPLPLSASAVTNTLNIAATPLDKSTAAPAVEASVTTSTARSPEASTAPKANTKKGNRRMPKQKKSSEMVVDSETPDTLPSATVSSSKKRAAPANENVNVEERSRRQRKVRVRTS